MLADIGVKTTLEQREVLARAGFVHVTGLTAWGPMTDQKSVIRLNLASDLGNIGYNNGVTVIVTLGAEIWLAVGPKMDVLGFRDVATSIFPKQNGAFVPCSNGESVYGKDLLRRIADPDWEPR